MAQDVTVESDHRKDPVAYQRSFSAAPARVRNGSLAQKAIHGRETPVVGASLRGGRPRSCLDRPLRRTRTSGRTTTAHRGRTDDGFGQRLSLSLSVALAVRADYFRPLGERSLLEVAIDLNVDALVEKGQ